MTLFALGLVLTAGFLHATWNLLAKRAGSEASGPVFVWLYSALSTAIFAPLAAGVFMVETRTLEPWVYYSCLARECCTSGTSSLCKRATGWGICL